MARERVNPRYLPGVTFPSSLHPIAELESAIADVRDVLLAVPSHAFRELLLARLRSTSTWLKR